MVQYNFKGITVVPSGKEVVDIILSRTQRQTPTVVHKGYAITRLRQFYMRKVRFTEQNFHEKLSAIIEEFPRLEGIHPFYSDLLHVLYNKDHYKLALGQVSPSPSPSPSLSLSLLFYLLSHYVHLVVFAKHDVIYYNH
jgi:nucleolar GTP-binding protein